MGKTYTQEQLDAALEQMRVSTLEEAAKVCEERGWEFIEPIRECAAAIRNLKDKA